MSVLGTAKSNRHHETHQVEPDGTGRKYMFLPGEISPVRAGEKSAEAVVALIAAERRQEQRAEASRKDSISGLAAGNNRRQRQEVR